MAVNHTLPVIIPAAKHGINDNLISKNAHNVLAALKAADYKAYLVGGGVRDLLLGQKPKDFDVVTDARPEQVRALFQNSRLIGRRFRLAHVYFRREIIEVSTFRATTSKPLSPRRQPSRIINDNIYGDIDDDVWRRDFTVNALFYDPGDQSIIDYVGGMQDLAAKQLNIIGKPSQRYMEDPVRMLRAIRFSAKLGFTLHPESARPIAQQLAQLKNVPTARLFEEVLKLFMHGAALASFYLLKDYQLFQYLFPQTDRVLSSQDPYAQQFIVEAMNNMDQRIDDGKPITADFLLAVLLWSPMQALAKQHSADGLTEMEAVELATETVLLQQTSATAVPRRLTSMIRTIWLLQVRLTNTKQRYALRLLQHPKFRAAYDFLLLRAAAGEPLHELVAYWNGQDLPAPKKPVHQRRHYWRLRRA